MATDTWRTPFDVLGLATYITIMTGELPDRELLDAARGKPAVRFGVAPQKPRKTGVSSMSESIR